MKPKISLVTLGVADVARAVRFYRDGLGFQTHNYADGDEMVMFELEGAWLGLYPRSKLADETGIDTGANGFSGVTLAHNVATEAEADAVFALALAAGATAVKRPQRVFWGGYSGYFSDPDGYLWEVAVNPFTDLT